MTVSINNFIDIQISKSPTSINERNVGVIGIFTDEEYNTPFGNYKIYKSPEDCGVDFGIDSKTYKMVNSIFTQSPNILNANGYVVVFVAKNGITIPATSGSIEFNNLIFSNFENITNGGFNIQVDEQEQTTINNLNFSNVKNIENIVDILKENETLINLVDISFNENNIIFTSKTTGENSKVIITSPTDESVEDITTVDFLNASKATLKNGTNEYIGKERLQDIFTRTQKEIYYCGCLSTYDSTDEEILETAKIVEGTNSILLVCKNDLDYLEDNSLFDNIKKMSLTKTRCLYYGGDDYLFFASSYLSSYMSVNYGGIETVKNLHSKELIGILPDTTIDNNILEKANKKGVDVYCFSGGVGAVFCSGENEWFDTVAGLIWLKIQLENAGFSALRNVPTKIPQTEKGISILYNAYENVLNQASRNGFIAGGKWNLPLTFGNQELMLDNILNYGYYIYFNSILEQTQDERDKRIAPLCQIAIKLAGAINKSNVLIFVNN